MGYKTLIVKRKNETGKRWMYDLWANGKKIISHDKKKDAIKHGKTLRRWK